MKMPWRKLLEVALEITEGTIPGGKLLIGGVKGLLDPDDANNLDAIENIEAGLIVALESVKETDVANEALFNEGTRELYIAFRKIRASFKIKRLTPTVGN